MLAVEVGHDGGPGHGFFRLVPWQPCRPRTLGPPRDPPGLLRAKMLASRLSGGGHVSQGKQLAGGQGKQLAEVPRREVEPRKKHGERVKIIIECV